MAIQKDKLLPSGVTGNYWKITKESYNKTNNECTYEISLFLNKEVSDANGASLGIRKIYNYIATDQELAGDRTALGYVKIKEAAAAQVMRVPFAGGEPTTGTFDPDLANGLDV